MSLAVELGGIARHSGHCRCFVIRGCIILFGKGVGADVQLGPDWEISKGFGIVLVCFNMDEMGTGGEQAGCDCDLLDDIPVGLKGSVGVVPGVSQVGVSFVEEALAIAEEAQGGWERCMAERVQVVDEAEEG